MVQLCAKWYGVFSKTYPKYLKAGIQILCTPMFIAAQITLAKRWMQAKCSFSDRQKRGVSTGECSSALISKDVLMSYHTPCSLKSLC